MNPITNIPPTLPIKDPDNSESDDELPSNGADSTITAINDNGNSQTDSDKVIPPGVSPPFSAPVLSRHPPLPPPSVATTSTALPVHVSSVVLKPIPPSVFYASTTWPKQKRITGRPASTESSNPVQAHLNSLSQAYSDLSQQISELRSENLTLKAHCAIAGTEIQDLKWRLNTKENRPKKRRKLNVDARWLNSDEGLRLAEEQEALRMAEEQKKCKAREQRVAKEVEREEQRWLRDPNAPFTGALTSKTKADLQDIAQVLGLTTDGQKKDILARITVYFDTNPAMRDDARFEGIFNRTRRNLMAGPQYHHLSSNIAQISSHSLHNSYIIQNNLSE